MAVGGWVPSLQTAWRFAPPAGYSRAGETPDLLCSPFEFTDPLMLRIQSEQREFGGNVFPQGVTGDFSEPAQEKSPPEEGGECDEKEHFEASRHRRISVNLRYIMLYLT